MTKAIRNKYTPVIYGTGLVSLDVVVSADPEEPTYHWAGGTCGNVLTALSYLGWKSFPIARLNGDTASVRVKGDLKRWGVDLTYAELQPTTNTPIITQENGVDKNGRPTHKFHWRNCPKCGSWLPNYRAVTLASIKALKEEVSSSTVFFFDRTSPAALELARHFKCQGAIIFFEPSAKSDLRLLEQALELADIVKYSNDKFLAPLSSIKGITKAFLEVKTLGGEGLQYRTHTKCSLSMSWKTLPAFQVSSPKDASGCGDWSAAGLISQLWNTTSLDLMNSTELDVVSALRYGQALAAWNYGFEGARGGMYRASKKSFNQSIQQILSKGGLERKTSKKPLSAEILESDTCLCCNH